VQLFAVSATTLFLLASGVVVAQTPVSRASRLETYQSAAIDANGDLAILTTNGLTVTVRKEGEQTSFSVPVLSSSKAAVGAQAMFPNCCTSYDIPLQLVVYAAGKVHRFTGGNLPIFQWAFVDGGERIAYGQEPVHFGCETHYELRDIESERLIEAVDVPQPCGLIPDPKPVRIPPWVADVTSKKLPG
jgi:hypothetical protein